MPETTTARTVGPTAAAGTTPSIPRSRSTARIAERAEDARVTPVVGTPGAATTRHYALAPCNTQRAAGRVIRTVGRVMCVTRTSGCVVGSPGTGRVLVFVGTSSAGGEASSDPVQAATRSSIAARAMLGVLVMLQP